MSSQSAVMLKVKMPNKGRPLKVIAEIIAKPVPSI